MTQRSSPRPDDNASRQSLRTDTRAGAASQIDFANAMAILLFGVMFFFGVSTAMLSGMADDTQTDRMTSWRVSEHLVSDLFKESPGAATASEDCVESYFAESPSLSCEHSTAWGSYSGQEYLRVSLGVDQHTKISLRLSGPRTYELGPEPPETSASEYRRRVVVTHNDGSKAWYTLTVNVW